jgi:cobalt-precorrin-5B (C1)-methyltransferase
LKLAKETAGLRFGFTTGACAAAAARAAVMTLQNQSPMANVYIMLNDNESADFTVKSCTFDTGRAVCSVIKDAGDDPDVTDGIEIFAEVIWRDEPGISIEGGQGVGRITKPGLELPVGEPAINPEPRRMITDAIMSLEDMDLAIRGVAVTISAPDGRRLARRTLNNRLGISGGISILGTSGYVIPYSTDAYRATISLGISVAAAQGLNDIVLTTGRRSEKYAQAELKLPEECYVQAGDHIGLALDECVKNNITRIHIWGMAGKLSKLAVGEFYTHVEKSQVDIGFLAGLAANLPGVNLPGDESQLNALGKAVTAHHFIQLLTPEIRGEFNDLLCRTAALRCREYIDNKAAVKVIMSDYKGNITGRSDV